MSLIFSVHERCTLSALEQFMTPLPFFSLTAPKGMTGLPAFGASVYTNFTAGG